MSATMPTPYGAQPPALPTPNDDPSIALNHAHDHRDLVQCVAFNTYGDRCATGSVDGRIRVFNRQRDGCWRLCDKWGAHGGEVLEMQWLPAQVHPNLLASLGIEGRFKLWAEDPSAPPGRRFHNGGSRTAEGKPAYETRNTTWKAPYRSFSMRYSEETRVTTLALLASNGHLSVHESDEPENLAEGTCIDEFFVVAPAHRPARGEEVSFKVRFDPNPEPCYAALRAGLPHDSLSLVVAAMTTVRVYRSREVPGQAYGSGHRQLYCALEIDGVHRGLVRDVAWARGSIRGYDVIATACGDGLVRVFRIDTPLREGSTTGWTMAELGRKEGSGAGRRTPGNVTPTGSKGASISGTPQSGLSAGFAKSGPAHRDRSLLAPAGSGQQPQGAVAHTWKEMSRLGQHGCPVWRVGFDDDGKVLGSSGDDGHLLCFRQKPDGTWAPSSDISLMRMSIKGPAMAP